MTWTGAGGDQPSGTLQWVVPKRTLGILLQRKSILLQYVDGKLTCRCIEHFVNTIQMKFLSASKEKSSVTPLHVFLLSYQTLPYSCSVETCWGPTHIKCMLQPFSRGLLTNFKSWKIGINVMECLLAVAEYCHWSF